ncbi:hypothetical protein acsn021_38940 [Anaerocolumna cellulosilytica]|uniref:Uncharacterized protein n=1 Tax=Anaerocolumna cellulosilytica TaxID=433286 RepID=A0A6S6RBB3_9FIRM|nr:NlpC/P60 family protein [Anaerocolumna cellulosilytica]MBB5196294.1 hypothetical protein [Anaerocolumna cellulosilytica]BCJ96325.1 hypothetical protein acsn021_38940 [Anaerocolumna cellulosilytica]
MNIKKIQEKPMVIHTKQKNQIHSHQPKSVTIKGGNIYTRTRSPKIKAVAVNKNFSKAGKSSPQYRNQKPKKIHLKSTVHGEGNVKEPDKGKLQKKAKESNQSIKGKQTNLHITEQTGAIGARVATDQMEGGKEIQQATYMAHEAFRPVTGIAYLSANALKKQIVERKKRERKKVEAEKKLGKKSETKSTKETARETTSKATNETGKRKTAERATKPGTISPDTARKTTPVAGSMGRVTGIKKKLASGYTSRIAMEAKDTKAANKNRKLAFFLDKMKAQENQQDSIAKLMKDLVTKRAFQWIKTVAPMIGLVLLLLVLVVAMITIPVIAVVAVLYNSPFALFLPPLETGNTVQTVTSAYVAEFNREVTTVASDHVGYEEGQIVYVDYEGTDAIPSNYYDILAVYMVKYGVGDTATIMNDTSKAWLKSVVEDMCSYTTSTGAETETVTEEDGTTSTLTTTYLYVNISLKSYRDMISEYGFNKDEVEMLEEIMSPEYLSMLGWSGSEEEGEPGIGSLIEEEINAILASISDTRQKAVCSYVLHRVGYPYSQELRDSGNYYDCSSLAYYGWKSAGVNISNGGATTAAAEGEKLEKAGKTVTLDAIQPGDLIFYSYTNNRRYRDISHVAIYVGGGKVVEARSIKYGVVYREIPNIGKIVLIGRP